MNEQIYTSSGTDPTDALMAEPFQQDKSGDDNENNEGRYKDVGNYRSTNDEITGKKTVSQEESILHDIKSVIGSNQVIASAIAFAPGWMVDKAIKSEHDNNWTDAYQELNTNTHYEKGQT